MEAATITPDMWIVFALLGLAVYLFISDILRLADAPGISPYHASRRLSNKRLYAGRGRNV